MDKLSIIEAPELQAIEKNKAETIRATFEPMAEMLSKFEEKFNEIVAESEMEITKDVTAKAKRLRIDIGKVRIATEKVRKEQKEEYLRAGKAIDGVSNILKWAVTDKENKLKEIENHFEIMEKKRLDELQQQRVELLSEYIEDAHERNLSEMPDDVWDAYLAAKKKEHEDRIEAERVAEEERIAREKAEAEERERIRLENERLKAEAEERERVARIEAEKRAKEEAARKKREAEEQHKRDEAARIEREKHEAELRRQREEHAAKLKAEAEERERIEAEQRKEREKRERLEAQIRAEKEAEQRRIAEEQKRLANAEVQWNNRDEIILAMCDLHIGETDHDNGLFADMAESVADAIIAGKIPHVKYVG